MAATDKGARRPAQHQERKYLAGARRPVNSAEGSELCYRQVNWKALSTELSGSSVNFKRTRLFVVACLCGVAVHCGSVNDNGDVGPKWQTQ